MSTQQFPDQIIQKAFEKFQGLLAPELKFMLNGRLERGLAIAKQGGVEPFIDPKEPGRLSMYKVISSDPYKPPYLVDLHSRSCTCPDHWKGHFCKHRIAAHIFSLALQLSQPDEPPFQAHKNFTLKKASSYAVEKTPEPPASIPPSGAKPLPSPSNEAIVWGVIRLNGQILGVEVIAIDGDKVTVRALPKIVDGKKLQPQFPFPGKQNTTTLLKQELFHVRIFQQGIA